MWQRWFLISGLCFAVLPLLSRAADGERTGVNLAQIKLSGSLAETPLAPEPLFGTNQENFKSKLDRLKKAKDDITVQGVYLELDGLSVGWGKLDELRRGIADVRKAGKKVVAYMESANTSQDYLLACACDEICVPESGWVMLTGMRAEVMFFKELFEKIGVEADMLQMGDFKGAAEPYTRTSMSKEFRAQYESVLDDYFEKSYVEAIVKGRPGKDFTSEKVKKLIDNGPYTAKGAKEAGLIDHVLYPEPFETALKNTFKVERVRVTPSYGQSKATIPDLSNPFNLFKLLAAPSATTSTKPKVAVIYAVGVIVSGKGGTSLLGGESVGSTTIVEAIREAENDRTVKAIVLRVDSPGGSALASDLIWAELQRCKKPVIASMGDVAASGGYYISMGCRKIYAEPGTLTGSIGVVGGKITMGQLEKTIGLHTDVITRGAHADMLSTSRKFTDAEKVVWTRLMRDIYDQFLDKAVAGRTKAGQEMTREHLEKNLAGGRVWTGRQAKEHKLIDELGTLDDAIAAAKKMANFDEETELLVLPKPRPLLDQLLEMSGEARAPGLMGRQLLRDLPELEERLSAVEGMMRLRGEPVWVVTPYQVKVK
jgi:protease-4